MIYDANNVKTIEQKADVNIFYQLFYQHIPPINLPVFLLANILDFMLLPK